MDHTVGSKPQIQHDENTLSNHQVRADFFNNAEKMRNKEITTPLMALPPSPSADKYRDENWIKVKESAYSQAKTAFNKTFNLTRLKDGLSCICTVIKNAAINNLTSPKSPTATAPLTKEAVLANILKGKEDKGFSELQSDEKKEMLFTLISKHCNNNKNILNLLLDENSAVGAAVKQATEHLHVEENPTFMRAYNKCKNPEDFQILAKRPENEGLNLTHSIANKLKSDKPEIAKQGLDEAFAHLLYTFTRDSAANIYSNDGLSL